MFAKDEDKRPHEVATVLDQSLADTHSDIRVEHAHLIPFISNCYRAALQQLTQSYRDCRPAAILISEGRFGPGHVVDNFLTGIDESVAVARINGSASDSTSFMQDIVRSIGFQSSDMSITDLENVLDMFLRYQKNHKLRTVICIEDTDIHGWWVLDKIRRLVDLETRERLGLMIILSGPASMISVFKEPGLNIITEQAGKRIVLAPFTLAETREFLRQRTAPEHSEPQCARFDFFSANLIHELCCGVPDQINQLSAKSLELVDGTDEEEISVEIVKTAARLIGMASAVTAADETLPVLLPDDGASAPGRIIAKTRGEPDQEVLLDQKCILIGRDRICGICIVGLRISRYHALVVLAETGLQLVDLGSTNGTLVNGHKVKRCTLSDQDVITIGHTRITYVAGSEQQAWAKDTERSDVFEVGEQLPPPEPPINFIGNDIQFISSS